MKILIRNIILLAISLVVMCGTSCNSSDSNPEKELPPQTLIFYFTGTRLSHAFLTNISMVKEAIRQNIIGDSRIVCLFQGSSTSNADLIELTYKDGKCEETILASYSLPQIMDGQTVSYLLKDIISHAPAKRYGLVMAGHATAWVPISPISEGYDSSMTPSKVQRAMVDIKGVKDINLYDTRFIGDKTSAVLNCFDIDTLSEALASTGVKFEYILFDACFMSNVESAYQLRNNSRYIIASPCEIIDYGFPYDTVVPNLMLNKGTAYDLDAVCRAFNKYYNDTKGCSGSVALIDCAQLDALAASMKKVNMGAKKEFDLATIQTYEGQAQHLFFDLGHYVSSMCGDEALASEFQAQLNRTIISKYTLDLFYSNYTPSYSSKHYFPIDEEVYSGITTSAPATVYVEDYKLTAWYKATN